MSHRKKKDWSNILINFDLIKVTVQLRNDFVLCGATKSLRSHISSLFEALQVVTPSDFYKWVLGSTCSLTVCQKAGEITWIAVMGQGYE